jgi:RHS repeat-associated protein
VVGVTDADATLISQTRYTPFGEIRSDVGTVTETDYGYTFQRNVDGMGLMDYKARYYSPLLGRFTQPDSIIPSPANPQSWNRFAYTLNNPIRYTDPSGNRVCDEDDCLEKIKNGTGKNSKPTTVKALLYGGYQDTQAMLRAYIKTHPGYDAFGDAEIRSDRLALSAVTTAQMQVTVMNGHYEKNKMASKFVDLISIGLDYGELFGKVSVPPEGNIVLGALSQMIADKSESLTRQERTMRALIVGVEGVATAGVAAVVAGGSGIAGAPTGPADIGIVVGVFTGVYIGLLSGFNKVNENLIFPHLHQVYGVTPLSPGFQSE